MQDFGGTENLLGTLARGDPAGWTPELLYAKGELHRSRGQPGDFEAAVAAYEAAIAGGSALPETWRAALRDYLAKRPNAGDALILASMAGGS